MVTIGARAFKSPTRTAASAMASAAIKPTAGSPRRPTGSLVTRVTSDSDRIWDFVAFTLVELGNDGVGEVKIVNNSGHEQGGCMAPVMLLKEHGVDVLLAGGAEAVMDDVPVLDDLDGQRAVVEHLLHVDRGGALRRFGGAREHAEERGDRE